jgi:hypothetical protein
MKKARQYSQVISKASKNKQDLLSYADDLMISLDGVDMNIVDLGPLAEMITHVRALDWVRHSLKGIINNAREGAVVESNDLEAAQQLLPTVNQLFTAYKTAVNGVNAVLSK